MRPLWLEVLKYYFPPVLLLYHFQSIISTIILYQPCIVLLSLKNFLS